MQRHMANSSYNPDVLNCIANLSNDEVFTPPELANRVLDLLPKELFESPATTFLDPFTKSGVFLREIVKRLDRGLESRIPDRQTRIDHILHKQVFGIAVTELTSYISRRSVYCSKTANGKYSVSRFDNESGNILYSNRFHAWENGRCQYCGATQTVYDRGPEAEQYAYQFIHTDNPQQFFGNMKFDVIIGNPPYQLNDGGGTGASAMPIYHKFVLQAKRLNPRFISMIIPSRWFVGGKGLDEFREEMTHDSHLQEIHDFIDANDCFPGVEIKGGVCYFLWNYDHTGDCLVCTHEKGIVISSAMRPLLEKRADVFIRFNEAIPIFRKVVTSNFKSFMEIVSSRRPFGINSTFMDFHPHPRKKDDIKIYANKKIGFIDKDFPFEQNADWVEKYKLYISFGYGAGEGFPHQILNKPFVGEKHSCCTETYLLIGPFDSGIEADNVRSYITTKFFRFMVMMKKNTQNGTKSVYQFVPMQDFSHPWTDEMLYKKYELIDEEIAFIESMIRPME